MQVNCRMRQGEHSAILSTFINLPFDIKIFALSIFEWPFYTGFTVMFLFLNQSMCCRNPTEMVLTPLLGTLKHRFDG